MTRTPITVVAVLVLVLSVAVAPALAVSSPAESPPAPQVGVTDPAEAEAWFDEAMGEGMERHRVPGAAVVLVVDGEFVLAKGYGYADVESERPVVADETVFPIGSTSKLVTWTAVMQGVEDGRLELDRDVNDYLTDSPVSIPDTYSDPVTLEHLGTHTAGFEDSFEGILVPSPDDVRPLGTVLAEGRPARVRPPGEYVAYSNYGAGLAGHVVAEEYDTSYESYVDERIFRPLNMTDSTFAQPVPDRLEARMATGYAYRDGAYEARPFVTFGIPPEGAMSSTATDMGRFMLAHLGEGASDSGRILDESTVADMHRRHFSNAPDVPEQNGMAYGFIEMDRNGREMVGHWGTAAEFMSMLVLVPEHETGLFVVYNGAGGDAARFELLDAFADRFFPAEEEPVGEPPAGADDRAAKVVGEYRTMVITESSWHRLRGVLDTVTVEAGPDGRLVTRQFGGSSREWVEVRPGVYGEVGGSEHLVFLTDESGRGTHLSYGSLGSRTYERLAWYESIRLTEAIVLGGALGFCSALVAWAGGPLWRRLRNRPRPDAERAVARGLLGGASLLWVVTLAIFARALLNFNAEVTSPSLLLRVGHVLPFVALALTLGAVVAAVVAWRDGYWSVPARLGYTAIAVLAVAFAWQMSALGILSW